MQERERRLINNLRTKITPFVQGDEDMFVVSAMSEAKHLSEKAFGTAFLHTIGCDASRTCYGKAVACVLLHGALSHHSRLMLLPLLSLPLLL